MKTKKEQQEHEDLLKIASYVILFITGLIFILSEPVPRGSTAFSIVILLLTAILVLNIFSSRMQAWIGDEEKTHWVFLVISAVLILLISYVGLFYNIIFMLFMFAAQAFMMLKFRAAALLVGLTTLGYLLLLYLMGIPLDGIFELSFSLVVGMVFVITLSLVLVRYSEQTARVEKLNAQLLQAQQQVKELAAAEERVRLARDIHDGLGHHLTTLNIQLQAAEKLLDQKPEKAKEVLRISRQEAKAALEEVRHSVAVMRRNPLDGKTLIEAVQHLIRDIEGTLKAEIQFEAVDLPTGQMSPQVSNTLYRCVQEGLTNIQKHAQNASLVKIVFACVDDEIHLMMEDDGTQAAPDQIESGFGLAGLRERVELLGGQMQTEKADRVGFKLSVQIKAAGGQDD